MAQTLSSVSLENSNSISPIAALQRSSVGDQWNLARNHPNAVPALSSVWGAQDPEKMVRISQQTSVFVDGVNNAPATSLAARETWLNLEQAAVALTMARFDVMASRCKEEITKSLKENGIKFMRGNHLLYGDEVHEQILNEAYLPAIDDVMDCIWAMGIVPIFTQLVRVSTESDELQPIPVIPEMGTYDISFITSAQNKRVYKFYHRIDLLSTTLPPQRHPDKKGAVEFLRRFDPLVTVYDRFGYKPTSGGELTAPLIGLMPVFRILSNLESYLDKGIRGESEPLLVTEYDRASMPEKPKERAQANYAGSRAQYEVGNDEDDDLIEMERRRNAYNSIFNRPDSQASTSVSATVLRAQEDVSMARARHVQLEVGRKLVHHIPAQQPKDFVAIRTTYEELVCTRLGLTRSMFINDRVVRANVEAMNNSFKTTLTHYRNHIQRLFTEFYRANFVDSVLQQKKLEVLRRALERHTALYFQNALEEGAKDIAVDKKANKEDNRKETVINNDVHTYIFEHNIGKKKKKKNDGADIDTDSENSSSSEDSSSKDDDATTQDSVSGSGSDTEEKESNKAKKENRKKQKKQVSVSPDSLNPVIYSKDPHLFDKREYGLLNSTKNKLFGLEREHSISVQLPISPFSSLETLRELYLAQVITFDTYQTKCLLLHGLPLTDANLTATQLTPKELIEMTQSDHGVRQDTPGQNAAAAGGGGSSTKRKAKSTKSKTSTKSPKSTMDKQVSSRPSGSNSGPNAASSGTTKSKKKLGE
jgi:hypothetical protein